MTTRRPNTNILLLAFAAIVGMLSFADVASACTTTATASASPGCCASRPSSECDCCGQADPLPPSAEAVPVEAIIAPAARAITQVSSPSCECRPNEPTAPAKPTTSGRTDVQGDETFAVFAQIGSPSPVPRRLLLPNESPPKSPLYLRTSHLLI